MTPLLHHPLLPPIFGLDTRSLGLSRIALGLSLLFSEASVLQQQGWSLVGAAVILATITFTLGLATRTTTFLTWIGYFYLIRISPTADHGMIIAHNMLFYGIFLPLGEWGSLDALRREEGFTPRTVLSYPSCAWVLQMFFVYLSAGMTKDPAMWLWNPTAIQTILSKGVYSTQLGTLLAHYPFVSAFLTILVYLSELSLPFAIFIPDLRGRIRAYVALTFIAFHLGLAVTMKLDAFPFICMALWLSLIPFRYFTRRVSSTFEIAPLAVIEPKLGDRFVALGIVHMIIANGRVMFGYLDTYEPGSPMWFFTEVLGLRQMWVMFNIVSTG